MGEPTLKQVIEGLKDILVNQLCETNYPMRNYKALSLAISKLSLLEQVEQSGVKKKEPHWVQTDQGSYDENADFNEALTLYQADFARRLEQLPKIIYELFRTTYGRMLTEELAEEFAQALTAHFTNPERR